MKDVWAICLCAIVGLGVVAIYRIVDLKNTCEKENNVYHCHLLAIPDDPKESK